jgi:hypothetical protein
MHYDEVPYAIFCEAMVRNTFHVPKHVPLVAHCHDSPVVGIPKGWKDNWDSSM